MPETMIQPTETEAPICATQKCKRPLTRLGPPWNCWRCLVCNPIVEAKKTEPRKRRDVDVQMSEERVLELIKSTPSGPSVLDEEEIREIIQDELQNWFIQKPPVTRDEIVEITGTTYEGQLPTTTCETHRTNSVPWRKQAKELNIPLNKETGGSRLKVDVLADIAKKTEESPKGILTTRR